MLLVEADGALVVAASVHVQVDGQRHVHERLVLLRLQVVDHQQEQVVVQRAQLDQFVQQFD